MMRLNAPWTNPKHSQQNHSTGLLVTGVCALLMLVASGKLNFPLKIKMFVWQLTNKKLQTAVELKNKKWKGDIRCYLCGRVEDTDHIFFRCSIAQFVWCCLHDIFALHGIPTS
jgi:hypothetical protein